MIAGIFATHTINTPSYGATAAAPAPSIPVAPNPPQPQPIAFSAVVRASLFGEVGSAIGSTTLATITCADAAMTVVLSSAVPGLTFSYSSNVLSVSGTPTTSGVYRVQVSYMSSDGAYTVRGSTEHECVIVSASEEVTIDTTYPVPQGQVGRPYSTTICDLSANYGVDLLATVVGMLPGLVVELDWTNTGTSGSGTLEVSGTPTTQGTGSYTVVFEDRATGQSKVDISFQVVVQPAYVAPAPAPPAPPAPAPLPPVAPPAPTPAPAPGAGPDSLFDRVRVLMHMDAQTGLTTDVKGNTFTASGVNSAAGAVLEGAQFASPSSTLYGTVPGLAIVSTPADQMLTVECMCNASFLSLGADVFEGGRFYCPVVSCVNPDQVLVWSLGFMTDWVYRGINPSVVYYPAFIVRATGGQLDLGNDNGFLFDYQVAALGPRLTAGSRMVHLAGMLQYGTTSKVAVWWDGGTTGSCVRFDGRLLPPVVPGHLVRIGSAGVPKPGTSSVPLTTAGGLMLPVAALASYSGVVDELRITQDDRYSSYLTGASTQLTIPGHARVIPWADY